MALKIYNTLTRTTETFTPIDPGKIGMYLCGVTVYDSCHLGHGRTFVAFDVVRRWLEASGYEVKLVRNITDVDDKIIKRSAERGILPEELAKEETLKMQDDFAKLGCIPPTVEPKATQYIPQMLELIEKLEQKGYAYADSKGDVNYRVRMFKPYGALSGKNIDELRAGERVAVDESKEDPLDFALWKKAKPGEPQWDSKWGKGRPGWHIECSAMSCSLLGETFDIHAGGPDLKFPHHENEIAQSEAATGKKFVNTWMHSGPLLVDGVKMSKSLGNFKTIRDALTEANQKYGQGNGNEVVRFFLLRPQYSSIIDYTDRIIGDAHASLKRLYTALKDVKPSDGELDWSETYAQKFKQAMDDNFNTSIAVSALFELVREVNQTKSAELSKQLKKLGGILGILQGDPDTFIKGDTTGIDEAWILSMIEQRKQAKKAKDFARADAIRDELKGSGIILEDKPGGLTEWKKL